MRKAGFILSFRPYHRDKAPAGDGLLFFSDCLLVKTERRFVKSPGIAGPVIVH
jgi:hypothetical protein